MCWRAMIERRQPVAGLQHAIAVRLEQIVEELHVELIVLDDENRLQRGCPRFIRRSRHCVCTVHQCKCPRLNALGRSSLNPPKIR